MTEEVGATDTSRVPVVRDPNFHRVSADHGFVTSIGPNGIEITLIMDSQNLEALNVVPDEGIRLVGGATAVEVARIRMTISSALVLVGNILGGALSHGVVEHESIETMVQNLKRLIPEQGTEA